MAIKQLTVFVENKQGALVEITKKLGLTTSFTDSVDVTFKVGEIGNAIYKKTPSIKGNVVVSNRAFEEREIEVEVVVDDEDIFEAVKDIL